MAELLKNLHVCGNILSSTSYSFFALQCTLCNCACTFGHWTSFLKHLEQIHGSFSFFLEEDDKPNAEDMHEFQIDSNINGTEIDDLALPCIEEEHSIFLESKEEVGIDDNETDELMVEILQSETINESSEESFLGQRNLSLDSLAEENQILESLPSSPTTENAAGGEDFKKFKMSSEAVNEGNGVFDDTYYSAKNTNHIPFTEFEPIFVDFIERYKDNPVLWNSSLYNYNHRLDRKQILASWSEDFKAKYDLQLTYDDLSFSILEFRRIYYKNVQRRDSNAELDDLAKFILEKGSFLPPRNTIQPVKCQHCSKIFHQEHTLKRHIYMDHGIGDKPFKCGFCEQSFEDHLIHRRHEQRYHYKDYKYICEYCTKAFFTRDELDRHLVKHTGEKKFVCELCGRGFAKKTNLSLHNTRVHLRQRNFACSMCPKAFYTKRLLQDHINAHLNIRDKICPTCGKGFTSHHSLIRHKQIHAEIKKYACKLCDARFHQFVGLNSHMKNTHKYVRGKNETASDEQ